MGSVRLGHPIYSDVGVTYTPALSGGSWPGSLPLTNLQDRDLSKVARSSDVELSSTMLHWDLGVARSVGLYAVPKHTVSKSGAYARVLAQLETFLFDYEAGDDITVRGGTFTRAPSGASKASYVDRNGVLRWAPENRTTQSADFSHADWTASNVTVSSNSTEDPIGGPNADTLTASSANGTCRQGVTTIAITYTFSVWLKRKTGTGDVSITLDGTNYVVKTLTTEWQRFSVSQTGVAGTSNAGVKIVTSGDAVYAWGAQVEVGSTVGKYLATNTAGVSALRDAHFIGGYRHALLEKASTNLVLQSSNFGTTWSASGSPTRSAAAHTASGVTLDLIGDDDGAGLEGYSQTVTFTGDAVKAISLFVKKGTSAPAAGTLVRVLDSSAAANRLLATITWSGTVPSVSCSVGTFLGKEALADGVYRILLATSAITAANTNTVDIFPAEGAANTGNIYAGGVQAENSTVPTSFVLTTTATVARAGDHLYFPYLAAANQTITVECKFTEIGTALLANSHPIWSIGNVSGGEALFVYAATTRYDSFLSVSGGSRLSQPSVTPAYGDTIRTRTVLDSTGTVLQGTIKNAAAEVLGATSATVTLPSVWNAQEITLGANGGGTSPGIVAIQRVRVIAGTKTMAEMEASVYDSGWLDAWPTDLDAEETDGINVPFVHIPSSAHSSRYGSLQIDDTANSAGVVDLARLVVAKLYEPTINMRTGAQLGLVTGTKRVETDHGAAVYDVKPIRRFIRFVLEHITKTEAFASPWLLKRLAGLHGQLFVVYDDDDTDELHAERSFLGVLTELGVLEEPNVDTRYATAFQILEEL